MTKLNATILDRDDLVSGMTTFNRYPLREFEFGDLSSISLPKGGAIAGRWTNETSDPFPELIVVREDDFDDTMAWLSSFFTGLVPITQWSRVVHQAQIRVNFTKFGNPTLDGKLGAWVGAVLAECKAQSVASVNLRELSGNAALSSSSFAAGRSVSMLGCDINFEELAAKHDAVSNNLRLSERPISASDLVPVWEVVSGHISAKRANAKALKPLAQLIEAACKRSVRHSLKETLQPLMEDACDLFDLPQLKLCGEGVQNARVQALDELASVLLKGPKSPVQDALLGLGACFVDPGVAIVPELLKKHTSRLPLAEIWLGVFAGALAPTKVLSEQNGLGRLISKALLAPSDVTSRPACDVSFDELSRWFSKDGKMTNPTMRGMVSRSISVELMLGVTCSFPFSRSEAKEQNVSSRVWSERTRGDSNSVRHEYASKADLSQAISSISKRIERLERAADEAKSVQLDMLERIEAPAVKRTTRKKTTK